MKKRLICTIIISLFLISGCSFWNKKPPKVEINEAKQPLALIELEPPMIEKVKWTVITEENYKEVFADLKERGIDPVVIGFTDEYFAINAINFSKLYIFMYKQRNQLKEYKLYYESDDNLTEEESTNEREE